MSDLWHFTCKHGHRGIGRYGMVLPKYSKALGCDLSWFTDNVTLSDIELGLTSYYIPCDRRQFLYRVLEPELCEPFLAWARRTGNPYVGRLLDDARRPEHWFVSDRPVGVREERGYVKP